MSDHDISDDNFSVHVTFSEIQNCVEEPAGFSAPSVVCRRLSDLRRLVHVVDLIPTSLPGLLWLRALLIRLVQLVCSPTPSFFFRKEKGPKTHACGTPSSADNKSDGFMVASSCGQASLAIMWPTKPSLLPRGGDEVDTRQYLEVEGPKLDENCTVWP